MSDGEQYRTWEKDSEVLGQIGRALCPQPTTIEVRLPIALAMEASRAWDRDDGADDLPPETSEQRATRHRQASSASSVSPSRARASSMAM